MDKNFDDLFDRLENIVYGSYKGRLRLDLLWEDLESHLNISHGRPLQILDAGGGFGSISLKLAKSGHDIVLCDISEKMLNEAEKRFNEEGLAKRLTIIHCPLQELPENCFEAFDLVMSHAVMEWLEEPEKSFKRLVHYIKPGGNMSVMFYNLNSLVCQNAIKGNFYKLMNEEFSGHPNGLTPKKPLLPDDVLGWFAAEQIQVTAKTGIRVFYDLMFKKTRDLRPYEEILDIEKKYCRLEPFASLGRYVHVLGKKQ